MIPFQNIATALYPINSRYELIRIGAQSDGGYLVPADLKGITACFSPGVDQTASFESHLKQLGIGSHLADYSVDGAPEGFEPLSFTKKYLSGINDDMYMTLESWVKEHDNQTGDLILQMDIEGSEFATILSTPQEVLRRFRIIVMEIHYADSWVHPMMFNISQVFFAKLLQDFYVVHNHPNNNGQLIAIGDFVAPTVFELTLLRKDRTDFCGFAGQFPNPLDRKNVEDKDDIVLPTNWYRSNK